MPNEPSKRIDLRKRFSVAHPDATRAGRVFYDMICNSSSRYKDEISDIYFGSLFRYELDGAHKAYGNAMGVEASEVQIDLLFIGARSDDSDDLKPKSSESSDLAPMDLAPMAFSSMHTPSTREEEFLR